MEGTDHCVWCGEIKKMFLPICDDCYEMRKYAERARNMVRRHVGDLPLGFEATAICSVCGPLGFLKTREGGCADCYARHVAFVLCSRNGGLKQMAIRASLFDVTDFLKKDR